MKIKRLKSKDTIATFTKIVDSNYQSLLQYAYFKCGNLDNAKDIVQDAFLNTYKKLNSQAITNIKAYLFKSVYNLSIDRYKNSKNNVCLELIKDTHALHVKDYSHNITLQEEYKRINNILDNIPKNQQEVVRLKITEELSFVEISEILDIPVTTVKSRFKYALEKIKAKYNKEVRYEMQ